MEQLEKTDKKSCAILCGGHVTVDTYGGFLSPILPFIAANLGISITVTSAILSVSHLASSVMQPVFGYISDSMPKRFFIFWGVVLASLFMSLTGIMPNVWLLAIAVILGNVGVAFYHPQAFSLISHFSGRQVNTVMGIFTACGTIGYALGPMISAYITEYFGLKSLVYAVFPGMFFAFALYLFLPKIPKQILSKQKGSFFESVKVIFTNKILAILTSISIVKAMITISFCVLMPFLWKELGYPVKDIGNSVAAFAALGGIASPVGAKLADMLGRRAVFYVSLIPIFPLTMAVFYYLKTIPALSLALFALVGFFTMFSVSVNMITAQQSLPGNRAMISGVIGGFSWGVMGILLTPLGYLAQKFGIANIITIISATPILCCLFVKNIPEEIRING